MQDPLVLDALIAWRDSIMQRDIFRGTKIGHLSHMSRLVSIGLFDLEQPLSEFLKTIPSEKLKIIDGTQEWSGSTKQARRTILRSFYRFSRENKITPTIIPFQEYRDLKKLVISELLSSNEDKVMAQQLKPEDISRFLIEICHVNPRDSLICWMMWEFKCTIHQILDIKIKDIDFSKDIIAFKEELRLSPDVGMRQDLKLCILEQSKGKSPSDLLFTTDKGKRIYAGQISRSMKTASKRAKLPILMTPKILYADAKAYGAKVFQAMSKEDRRQLSNEYAKKITIPMEKCKRCLQDKRERFITLD
jgi:hypothetical protein